jgi:hypothetical protein
MAGFGIKSPTMHRIFRVRGGGLFLAALLLLGLHAGPALAQEEEDEAYKSAVGAAVQEFAAGNWAEARALFKRAHDLSPSARTLRGMGMAAYELRMYVPALRELEGAVRETRKPLDAEQVGQAEKLIKLASAFVGRYRVVVEPAEAAVRIDGRDAQFEPGNVLLLELGAHELTAVATGYQAGAIKFNTEGGEAERELELKLLPEGQAGVLPAAPPVPQPVQTTTGSEDSYADGGSGPNLAPWAWVMLGSAAAFGGVAGAMWAVGSSKYSTLEDDCGSDCSDQQIDDSGVATMDVLTNVFIGLAGAAAGTAVVLFILDAGKPDEKASAFNVNVGPGSLIVDGRF